MNKEIKENNSIMECCICNNYKKGEFIVINDKKYHLGCITNLQEDLENKNNEIASLFNDKQYYFKLSNELQQEREDLKTQLKGTTHCYDEKEHQRLIKENKKQEELISRLYSIISDDKENFKLLQEENERLKMRLLQEQNIADCKSRCEKAIEYIKSNRWQIDFHNEFNKQHLLNILEGSDKE